MGGSIDDKVESGHTQKRHETRHSYQTKYRDTRFTKTVEKVCDFMDRYVGRPFADAVENCLDYLSDASIKRGWNIIRYYDKHGNIVDKNGNIVDPAKVTIIGKGKKYKTNKEKPNKENCEGDANANSNN